MKRKALSLILALILCMGLAVPALAAAPAGVATVQADSIAWRGDGIFTVLRDGKYGFYKADGTELVAPTYTYARDFNNGMAPVTMSGEMYVDDFFGTQVYQDGQFGYIDETGKLVIPMKYAKAFDFSEDRAFVRETEDGPLLMIDKTGNVIASYDNVDLWPLETVQFSEGLAIIPLTDNEYHFIAVDTSGKTVYSFTDQYVDFENGYNDGLIAVAEYGEWGTGGPMIERGCYYMSGTGYRDKTGNLVISGDYTVVYNFTDGLAAVGVEVDDPMYYVLHYGFIDTTGKVVIPIKYDNFILDDGDIRGVSNSDELRAYVDRTGKEITPFIYDATWGFTEGLSLVRSNGVISVIDTTGKTIFTSDNCDRGYSYTDGLSVMWNSETGSCGVYDTVGNLVFPLQYDGGYVYSGYLWLKSGDTWTVYSVSDLPKVTAPAFSDVGSTKFYAEPVAWAVEQGITNGTSNTTFSPDATCTQGQIITFLWRAQGEPAPETAVDSTKFYADAAQWAEEQGLTDAFAADDPCTRAMVVTYLWKLAGSPEVGPSSFTDVDAGADYAQAVAWAVEQGITNGISDTSFAPADTCTRGQIVTFLYRAFAE